ncbi:hypothetical protein ZWY2020_031278 [Hordeum vulgare]|nr:hypothetical protein ZWY2020_031278 [Hordeum vulgare]
MAAAATSPLTPYHLPPVLLCIVLLLLPATAAKTTLKITNRCPYTVWPAAMPVGGGMQLDPGKTWTLDVPDNTKGGRVWARTGCSFDSDDKGSCQTGDCDGVLICKGLGKHPFTLAEFSLDQFDHNSLFYISLDNGFNVPMEFFPVPVEGQERRCKGTRCVVDIMSQCPSELKVLGGCNSTCPVVSKLPCKYRDFFVKMCPEAIIDSSDSPSVIVFSCPWGTTYQINFCPSVILTPSPAIPPSSKPPSPPDSPPFGSSSTGSQSRKVRTVVLIAVLFLFLFQALMGAASALFLFVLVITGEAATLRITNQCSYTVWPAVVPGGGRQLDPGEAWVLDVPAGNTSGRVWARTGCTFHGEGNVSSCQTGDCGGLLACTAYGRPPSTLGEFAFGGLNAVDSFDISVMDGFNVPMDFLPVPVQGRAGV